ncbi:aldolase citrate lyase family protein [Colletotrichum karsti]|uniref:Aldolase citrate lyase family protein n=1 Tax=Colletotrichum karsti TaxID=1095194 RepID=A0A9P6LPS7_9PEZI|nr:aldolase citrate lyase family protein [Colletotrichum karsti]KAF9879962.1 aldolase citrate lyase family protein [Colletotrichum karsti]
MFFLYNMERRVTLHPSYFGRNMHELVTSKLLKDVEGTCAGSYYIISIMDTFDISEGRILPGSGLAEFTVGYRAVVWRPFKGETVDAVVYSVNHQGFFAQAGPLRLFVSAHLIPSEIKWDPNATPPQFTNNEDTIIEPGTHVRVKVIGTRTEVGEMWAIGSIKEDYLGLWTAFNKGAGPSLGLWQMIPSANVSRALARSPGVDWVLVDCEHGNIDDGAMHDIVPAIAAAGVSPIVRIPDMQGWMVKRALDCGAHGILVPLLRNAQEAKDLVQSAKFPPWGRRGFGSPFAMERFNPAPSMTEYLQQANDSLLTMVQIETKEALDSVDEIAAVEGIDVLFIGPFDLGNNIGHPVINGVIKKELSDAIDRILEATHKAGKKAGIFCTSGEQSKFFGDKGFDMISVATDYTALQYTVAESLSIARGAAKPAKGGSY